MPLPKFYRAEKGIRGSDHYAGATFLTRAEAEACADRLAGAWDAHPAARPCVLSSVEELPPTPAEARTLRACLRAADGRITLGVEVRGVRDLDLRRLEDLGLVRAAEDVWADLDPRGRPRDRFATRVRLTRRGRAWLGAKAEGGDA